MLFLRPSAYQRARRTALQVDMVTDDDDDDIDVAYDEDDQYV